ncbi:MAG: rhamnulokinase [Solirubrobacterales bacterium]|nr:rhamnulokinase [Solirubrobacterales bacterium]
MPEAPRYAAVDVGATSGRVVTGRLEPDGRVVLEEAHRFPNRPVRLPDGLRWNLLHSFTEALEGLRAAGPLAGVGVDTWGVDYALLDGAGRVLGLPFHYRDERTNGMIERAFGRVAAEEVYALTGIQTMPINTLFQLLADEDSGALARAERLALVPDLLAFWLSGDLANEKTNASTTGLLDARSGEWARDLVGRLGLPGGLFGPLVEPGTALGPLLAHHELGDPTVYAVASHDTASAFAAAPVDDEHAAILSSGTWSLLGVELPAPVLSDAARGANLTNERGVDGTTRLLKNVMGMWLLEECRRGWGAQASYEELLRLAEAADGGGDAPLFDPDDPSFLAPGDMPGRIAAACTASGQEPPGGRGAIVRAILQSLACKYRWVLERLEAVSGRDVHRIHVIGGGARNTVLCRQTAEITGLPVLAGPVEATALGNVLVQLRGARELGSLAEMRVVASSSASPIVHEPTGNRSLADATYERFLALTGLNTPTEA